MLILELLQLRLQQLHLKRVPKLEMIAKEVLV